MKEKIYYLGYYTCPEIADEKRKSFPAADTKMEYIIYALSQCNKQVQVISASETLDNRRKSGGIKRIADGGEIKTFFSLGKGCKIKRLLNFILAKIQLLAYLIFTLQSDDCLLVYHSLTYINIVKLAKRIKKFNLILEVEEIYSDVNGNEGTKKIELDFFTKADEFILSTSLLNESVNKKSKPYAVANGSYKVSSENYLDAYSDRKHIVYAGTLDPRKGGAIASAKIAEFLNSDYHIHILGFGSDAEINNLNEIIDQISQKTDCKITYDGLKRGDEYLAFLRKCHIGLSTQDPSAAFNETSFPSKILVYMANGLKVVSIRIPAIEQSEVGEHIYYYDNQDPSEIAGVIKSIDLNSNSDTRNVLRELDKSFVKRLKTLIDGEAYES